MKLVPFDARRHDVRSQRNAAKMARCKVCDLPPEYHQQIQMARQEGNGATIIRRYLEVDCDVVFTQTEMDRHIEKHLDSEGLCLRSDRRPSTTSADEKPSKKRSPTSSTSPRR